MLDIQLVEIYLCKAATSVLRNLVSITEIKCDMCTPVLQMTTLKVIKQHFFWFLLIRTLLPYTSTKKLLEPGPLRANQFTEAEGASLDFAS